MKIFAFVENGIVTNLVIASDADVAGFPYRDTEGQDVRIGWGCVDGVFVAPPPAPAADEPPAADERSAALYAAREALASASVAIEAAIASAAA